MSGEETKINLKKKKSYSLHPPLKPKYGSYL